MSGFTWASGEHRERSDSGLYVLWLDVPAATSLRVGALGLCHFEPGLFAYVGSARRGRSARIARHLRIEKPRHWHIDYLRPAGRIVAITLVDGPDLRECSLAEHLVNRLGGTRAIPGFGSSDCRCSGHLLRFADSDAWQRVFDLPAPASTVATPLHSYTNRQGAF